MGDKSDLLAELDVHDLISIDVLASGGKVRLFRVG